MRFWKPGMALAILLAVTALGGSTAYADSTPDVVVARDPDTNISVQAETKAASSKAVDVTVKTGDTLSSIAAKYRTSIDEIVERNNITNPDIITVGEILHIESGSTPHVTHTTEHYDSLRAAADAFLTPTQVRAAVSTPTTATTSTVVATHVSSAGNTYVWGTCTWYVKQQKPNLPNRLGNGGYGWLVTAAAAGYKTGSKPVAGAIGVESGHVVIVESVHANGTVSISEMNYAGGVGVVHRRTVPASEFQYIYA